MSRLIHRLSDIVGPSGILVGEDVPRRLATLSTLEPGRALAFVRPACTTQLSQVLAVCHEARQPLTIQGGLTGLVDGAMPADGELVISLERMNRIESIDPSARTLVAQAGAPIQAVQERAAQEGLVLAVDWGARGTATVGGGISTNAGGNAVLRYGMMREQVLGLEAVLADGTVLSSMNTMLKNNTGYDLKHLFIGSEGTLGIVTRAVLRLRPAMKTRSTALVAVESFDDVVRMLNRLDAELGGTLSAFEVMWQEHLRFQVEQGGHRSPLDMNHGYYILVEATGSDESRDGDRFEALLAALLEEGLAADAVVATSGAQRAAMWTIREDVETMFRKLNPLIMFDVSVAPRHVEKYLDAMGTVLR